jgi:peroxiredoxin family protein
MSGNGNGSVRAAGVGLAMARHPSAARPEDRDESTPLSVVLLSGTDDRLEAASVLIAGAAVMDRPVNVLLQYWAVEAFVTGALEADHGLAPEASLEGAGRLRALRGKPGQQHWSETLRQAKDLGEVTIRACAKSMDAFGLEAADLDPLVDGVEGVASFLSRASGPVTFI